MIHYTYIRTSVRLSARSPASPSTANEDKLTLEFTLLATHWAQKKEPRLKSKFHYVGARGILIVLFCSNSSRLNKRDPSQTVVFRLRAFINFVQRSGRSRRMLSFALVLKIT